MRRASGLLVLGSIVLLGLGSGAAYFQYKAPRLKAEFDAEIAALPTSPAGRLEAWHVFGAAQIHHRLSTFARFSSDLPWLVTHALDRRDGGEPELFGIDCSTLPLTLSHLEGMQVIVELPEPRSLGRVPLRGDQASFVPIYEAGQEVPDPDRRLRFLAIYFLDKLPEALAKEVEGASLEIRIVPASG